MSTRITGAIAALAFAITAGAAGAQNAVVYHESQSSAAADGAYFYAYHRRSDLRISVIIAFDEASTRPDNAAALWISQSIDCDTRQITTDRYQVYGDDGALLLEQQNIPAEYAALIGADIWSRQLNAKCEPPQLGPIPVAVDPPPTPDRDFDGQIRGAGEAITLLRARADARTQAAALTEDGTWGTFTGRRVTGGAYIDYAASDASHMSYLVAAPWYQRDWSYGRARYAVDCAAQTALVEYLVLYNETGEVISTDGPTRSMPTGHMVARDAITAFCTSNSPRGRTYPTLSEALTHLRREIERN
jgi:hypothetical protein